MVDLAFLLITFFILTTTMQKNKAFGVVMPDNTGVVDEPIGASRTMTICLGNNNQAVSYLGMTENPLTTPQITGYGKDGIRKAIVDTKDRVKQATGKDVFVIIKAGEHSNYENLVNTLDELHIAGATGYAIEDITPAEVNLLKQKGVY